MLRDRYKYADSFTLTFQALSVQKELGLLVFIHRELDAIKLSNADWETLGAIARVSHPLFENTNKVSESTLTITQSLNIYWNLKDLFRII